MMPPSTPPRPPLAPDAALYLPEPCIAGDPPGRKLYFFKHRRFAAWDVESETLCPGYPRDIALAWPGLAQRAGAARLRAAMHVPAWGPRIHFFFEGRDEAAVWDLAAHRLLDEPVSGTALLPGLFPGGDCALVYSERADRSAVIDAFKGREMQRWAVQPEGARALGTGAIAQQWKDGLTLAPRCGVYLEWPNRSSAHSNRKIYFFMGDLYLRWDVPSDTRNYRLDIVAGWKGWPDFGAP
jgi:hypothetical protein